MSNSPHVANDVDGNGVSDLLWFNPFTNQFGYWLMSMDSQGNFSSKGSQIFNVTPGYFVAATGDFDGDGLVDLIWTSANRDLYLWTNKKGWFSSAYLGTYPAGWIPLGAADVDGDGQADLLWWNESTSQFGYWIMKNGKQVNSQIFSVAAGYHVVATGYFNSSNRVSILWEGPNGELYAWDSQGSWFTSSYIATLTGTSAASRIDRVNASTIGIQGSICFTTIDSSPAYEYCWARMFNLNGTVINSSFIQNGGIQLQGTQNIGGSITSIGLQGQMFVYTVPGSLVVPPQLYIPGTAQSAGIFTNASYTASYPYGWYIIGSPSNKLL